MYSAKEVHEDTVREVLNFLANEANSPNTLLSQDFTILEMHKALKGFKRGKAPEADGLPLEFYLTFWDILAHELLAVFNDLETLDRLPGSFRIGIVSLLYKKGDRTDLKNWRPITLLNLDCKLFSKVLATRMSTVLEDVIHLDQACAVPGRKITDSLVLTRDTIFYARDRNIRLVVLNLDFEKAFDRVSHQYLFQVLQKMGFPKRFIAWAGLLSKGVVSKILVNGHLFKAVNICSGIRQVCPLSPLLYVACIEPLAQILRRDKGIKGLDVPGTGGLTATCVLYMDDVTLLAMDILSIRRAMDLTDWYGNSNSNKNTVRFQVRVDAAADVKRRFGREFIVTEVLRELFGVSASLIFCLQIFSTSGFMDLTFFQLSDCVAFHTAWEKKKEHQRLVGLPLYPAYVQDFLPLTIHLYNPFVEDGDVLAFLSRYCETVKGGERLKDRFGIWTGKRRYLVKLRPDKAAPGGLVHPPGSFFIGSNRFFLHYPGQPVYCRRCGVQGHF